MRVLTSFFAGVLRLHFLLFEFLPQVQFSSTASALCQVKLQRPPIDCNIDCQFARCRIACSLFTSLSPMLTRRLCRRAFDIIFGRYRDQSSRERRSFEGERCEGGGAGSASGALRTAVSARTAPLDSFSPGAGNVRHYSQRRLQDQSAVAGVVAAVALGHRRLVSKRLARVPVRRRSLPSGPPAPSSRVAAAKRIGGGYDKGERSAVCFCSSTRLTITRRWQRFGGWKQRKTAPACSRSQVKVPILFTAAAGHFGARAGLSRPDFIATRLLDMESLVCCSCSAGSLASRSTHPRAGTARCYHAPTQTAVAGCMLPASSQLPLRCVGEANAKRAALSRCCSNFGRPPPSPPAPLQPPTSYT
jgi:hypothetical protein